MKKIMIVDDEFDIVDVLQRFLTKSKKVEVSTYSNSENALKELEKGSYDLVLTDIMMPVTSGMEILESIKNAHPEIKVIIMTAYSTQNRLDKSKELKADGYIEKPFKNLKDVENIIFSALQL